MYVRFLSSASARIDVAQMVSQGHFYRLTLTFPHSDPNDPHAGLYDGRLDIFPKEKISLA